MTAWTDLTFPFASKLTSTKMTQLRDNFHALAEGSAGTPDFLGLTSLVGTTVVSSLGEIVFDNAYINTSYDHYSLWVMDYGGSVVANLYCQISSDNAASFRTSNYFENLSNSNVAQWNLGAAGISSNYSSFFHALLFRPWAATKSLMVTTGLQVTHGTAGASGGLGLARRQTDATQYDAIRLYPSTGHIEAGTFLLYGVL